VLDQLKAFFGVGSVKFSSRATGEVVSYKVRKFEDLCNIIIPHFENYSLITQKRADFLLFKKAVDMILSGEHLTKNGLAKIINIKASMNNGLSSTLKAQFPDFCPTDRPLVENAKISDPY
jgi:hypothetical protein